ncbi:MAG: hypothetical protein NTW74_17165 [Acidobacteria bacterium]|nr:hypothetical protein [Acidobacteriota bacterium]
MEAILAVAGSWQDEELPEMANGSADWVSYIRSLGQKRVEQIEAQWREVESESSSAAFDRQDP